MVATDKESEEHAQKLIGYFLIRNLEQIDLEIMHPKYDGFHTGVVSGKTGTKLFLQYTNSKNELIKYKR